MKVYSFVIEIYIEIRLVLMMKLANNLFLIAILGLYPNFITEKLTNVGHLNLRKAEFHWLKNNDSASTYKQCRFTLESIENIYFHHKCLHIRLKLKLELKHIETSWSCGSEQLTFKSVHTGSTIFYISFSRWAIGGVVCTEFDLSWLGVI